MRDGFRPRIQCLHCRHCRAGRRREPRRRRLLSGEGLLFAGPLILVVDEPDEPLCPRCQGATVLVRTFPKIGGFPELRSYSCIVCEEVVTVEREQ
jgi:hypothetical protein